MFTFSQMVDECVRESMRGDLRPAMVNALNQTIREAHFDSDLPVGFGANLVELTLTANVEMGFTYALPRPRQFMMMEAVWYRVYSRYATARNPGTIKLFVSSVDGAEYGYYRTADSFAFDNYGGNGAMIDLAWYEYLPRLQYYAADARPATWNENTEQFDYLAAYDIDDDTREDALRLSTNWMIYRHFDAIMEGLRSKIFKRMGDIERAKLYYSSAESAKKLLTSAERYVGNNFRTRG